MSLGLPLPLLAPVPAFGGRLLSGEVSLTEALQALLFPSVARPDRERRATTRRPLELAVEELLEGGRTRYRTTWDLSTFGLSTRGGPTYREGTGLTLRLYLPDDLRSPVEVAALVVGVNTHSGGMRLAFRGASPEVLRRIHRCVSALRAEGLPRA